jgi:hypothetical protein
MPWAKVKGTLKGIATSRVRDPKGPGGAITLKEVVKGARIVTIVGNRDTLPVNAPNPRAGEKGVKEPSKGVWARGKGVSARELMS